MREIEMNIETIRGEVLQAIKKTDNHIMITRAYEILTGRTVSHQSAKNKNIKIVLICK
jgi:hypothetical protein